MLADSLLFKAGAVDRKGSVDDKTSVSDYDDEEKLRHHSIDTTVLHLDYQGKRMNVLDAPGSPDFLGASLEALQPVETAVIVVSAPSGIEVNTRRMFNEAAKRGLARVLVINKMDADNIALEALLRNINDSFGKGCVLLNAPIGVGHSFNGVVSVRNPPDKAPAGSSLDLIAARSRLVDAIV
jgi:elongation factor G